MKNIKLKCQSALKNNNAAFSTPVILMGCVIFAVLLLIFCDSLKMASNGFKAREMANTIAKQISVTGEISMDTLELAKSCINEFEEAEGNENRGVIVQICDSNDGLLQNWGTVYLEGLGGGESYDFQENQSSATTSRNQIQLGDTCTVTVEIINKSSSVSSPETTVLNKPETNSSVFQVSSKAVSQIYWKELDRN